MHSVAQLSLFNSLELQVDDIIIKCSWRNIFLIDLRDEQNNHNHVREDSQEIGGFARALYTASHNQKNYQPGDEQAQRQIPDGKAWRQEDKFI